jgi:GNAT superfamily N-acetyltransferase
MTDLQTRPYQTSDAAAVADLINTISRAGGWQTGYVAAEIEDAVHDEVRDPAADTRIITDAEGRLVAAALVPLPPEGGDRVELIGGVHPDRRGEGIGRELLAWQLERAAARRAEIAPDAQWLAQVAAGTADASALRLCERLGFTIARYFLQMTAPTDPPPVAPLADGLRITGPSQEQERRLYAAHTAAFADLWGFQARPFESWAALTVRSEAFRPELSRLALAGDEIAGYVLAYEDAVPGRVYLGQLGTAAAWRRRGVASALLADVLSAAAGAGYTRAALDTDAASPTGAVGVYERAGFAVDQSIAVYRRPV